MVSMNTDQINDCILTTSQTTSSDFDKISSTNNFNKFPDTTSS